MQIKRTFLFLILSLAAYPIYAAKAANVPTPKDVESLIDRITGCNHWAGEEAYDKERAKQINQAVKNLRCHQLDSDEKTLRRKYKNKANILKILNKKTKIF